MTTQDAYALEGEMKHLKGILRPQTSQAITEIRELSNLKENAEYRMAREQQGMVEARIHDIETRLFNAQATGITVIPYSGKMIFGTTVDIVNIETGGIVTYRIVSDDEADVEGGKISVNSLIARILIGKTEGDIVLVRTPGGNVEYEIVEVRHI